MKHNQVYLDPNDVDGSMRQLDRFYRLDNKTIETLRRILEHYPKPVIVYVDEANAPYLAASPLDDLFTFNPETGELVLFSADSDTFINALIEMWMYVTGFETMMGDDDFWKVEFAIGAWKPVRDSIKRRLKIDIKHEITTVVGLPPEPEETPLEDPYPFLTLVSTLNIISFTQMIRLAGREEVRVHFPLGTSPKVIEVYRIARRAMHAVGDGLDIQDVEEFNRRLKSQLDSLERRYRPGQLPLPAGWQFSGEDREADSSPPPDEDEGAGQVLLGPPDDEAPFGNLPNAADPWSGALFAPSEDDEVDQRIAKGPFGQFIDTLFDDEP
jgi:hypothetical protein